MKAVGRAEFKLGGAVRVFNFDFKDKRVLDIGSSTGGFTEYAIKAGARVVVAIEKGSRQMKAPIRFDPRVDLHEQTDIFEYTNPEKFDVILADVSFVSLREVLEYAKKEFASEKTDFLVMLKPQFEAEKDELDRGIVKNEHIRRRIIRDFENWLKTAGFVTLNKHDNEVYGRYGNIERFYWLRMEK
ncbi:methyltransferase domain-containing protein [Candidatus Saccharibacteria bacterium]|nr:methyltransferase domain-containing protein [Candidatus Saccharibacteria bacterium]MBQ9017293.1 methyltransferase domain-containing protein [Candidatus Saccharibacteria bacterium]